MKRLITIWAVMLSVASASAQKVIEWNKLHTVIDENKRTVYYDRDSRKPLKGSYHIKRGLEVEAIHLKDGIIDGKYHRIATVSCAKQANMSRGNVTACSPNTM